MTAMGGTNDKPINATDGTYTIVKLLSSVVKGYAPFQCASALLMT